MMEWDAALIAMIGLGAVSAIFILLGVIGLHRFPDVYTRLHAATKATTFGSIFLGIGVIVYAVFRITEVSDTNDPAFVTLIAHTVLAILALIITNPTGAHAIARAARRTGVKPEQAVIDETEEVE